MVKLIVGLGNPGARYAGTRHNVGIEAVRSWAGDIQWREYRSLSAEVGEVPVGQREASQLPSFGSSLGWILGMGKRRKVWVLFPLTFMNESGVAVAKCMQKKAIEVNELVVVHDDLELPLGEVKWKEAGSAAGHKGVRSIQEHVGTKDITRLRLGIGRPPLRPNSAKALLGEQGFAGQATTEVPVARFVLQTFLPEEREQVDLMLSRAGEELSQALASGTEVETGL